MCTFAYRLVSLKIFCFRVIRLSPTRAIHLPHAFPAKRERYLGWKSADTDTLQVSPLAELPHMHGSR
jgi:hypothetical protein